MTLRIFRLTIESAARTELQERHWQAMCARVAFHADEKHFTEFLKRLSPDEE